HVCALGSGTASAVARHLAPLRCRAGCTVGGPFRAYGLSLADRLVLRRALLRLRVASLAAAPATAASTPTALTGPARSRLRLLLLFGATALGALASPALLARLSQIGRAPV